MASVTTFKWLCATSFFATLFCFGILSVDYDCGAQSWNCATYYGIAIVAILTGIALGFFLTALIVMLGWGLLLIRPSTKAPESGSRAGRVVFTLVLLHLFAFGMLNLIGVLPIGWFWWLGVFVVIGVDTSTATYTFVPAH